MKVLIINSGSSSIKYQLFEMPASQPICTGLIERIGQQNAVIKHKAFLQSGEAFIEKEMPLPNHEAGLAEAVALLTDAENGVINNCDEIKTVGHRIVHGGERYTGPVLITEDVKQDIKKLFSLAPLHNPAGYTGIEVAENVFSKASQIAIFDTAFHQTMPPPAYRYAIPNKLYTNNGIRAYGFHGTSHKNVTEQAIAYLNKPDAKLISIHLGNGCSMAAVVAGKCIDTSMGLGPLSGLVMGTRSGDIDPSVIFYMMKELQLDEKQVSNLLNKESGMLGMAGSNDMRDVNKAIANGNKEAEVACQLYAYRIKKYIGAYTAAMNGLDAIIFTAGVGENDSLMRDRICADMDYLSIKIDGEKNKQRGSEIREIGLQESRVHILVVPTNEELEIAKQCYQLLHGN